MLNVQRRSIMWFLAAAALFIAASVLLAGPASAQVVAPTKARPAGAAAQGERSRSTTLNGSDSKDHNGSAISTIEGRIEQALAGQANFDFNKKPLTDVIEEISNQHRIPILLDTKAIADAAIARDTPITRVVENVQLDSALRLMLRPLQLTYIIRDGVLFITTQAEADNKIVVRIHSVGDLLAPWDEPDARDSEDFNSLINVIQDSVAPTTWAVVGGPGSLATFKDKLIVSQTQDIHREVDYLITAMRKVRALQREKLGGNSVPLLINKNSERIRQTIQQPIEWQFTEVPLKDLVTSVAKQKGIGIQLDDKALADAAIAIDTPITFRLRGIPMASALHLMLRPLQLTFVVRDEVLLITTQSGADNQLQIRLYPLGDLVPFISAEESDSGDADWDPESLTLAIETTIAPTTWDSVGGPGSIAEYAEGLALVISQTQEVHEYIESLLARLRNLKATEKRTGAAAREANKADELLSRVYVLWQRVPKRPAQEAQNKTEKEKQTSINSQKTVAVASILTQVGHRTRAHASVSGLGGGLTAAFDMDEIPPAGAPAEDAERVIRGLIAPESWTEPGRDIFAVPHRLVVKQTRAVHREIMSLLTKLGPWREDSGAPAGLGGSAAIGGGAFCGGPVHGNPVFFPVSVDDDQSNDPFAPRGAEKAVEPTAPRGAQKAADPFGPAPRRAETDSERARQGGSNRRVAEHAAGQAGNGERPQTVRPDGRKRAPSFAVYTASPAEQRIREELGNPTDLEFNEVPLKDVVEFIKDKHGIEIQLDERLLTDAAVATDTQITMNVKGVALRSALRLMLGRLSGNPTFVVADEVLLITTRDGAAERKVVRVYNVGALVEAQRSPQGDPFGVSGPPRGYGGPAPSDALSELANVIQQAIEPGTWTPEHGCAVVPLVSKDTPLLVVRHSLSTHDEIVELLKSIHETPRERAKTEK